MTPILICNWKMNLTNPDIESLIVAAEAATRGQEKDVELVVCPAFTALHKTHGLLKLNHIRLGAQNMFWEDKGSFTGEVSPLMLTEVGCEYVILGHSERRGHCAETDEMVNRKVLKAIEHGLIPIVCVGETREQRESGQKEVVVMEQVKKALAGVQNFDRIMIAYEPVWVIGTGQAVSPKDAESVMQLINVTLLELFTGDVVRSKITLLYGGSVDASNIGGFLSEKDIHGVLVGGASMQAEKLQGMIRECVRLSS